MSSEEIHKLCEEKMAPVYKNEADGLERVRAGLGRDPVDYKGFPGHSRTRRSSRLLSDR